MHANRNYWASGTQPTPLTITGLTIADTNLSAPATCMSPTGSPPTPCLPAVMAAYDLQAYAQSLNTLIGNNPITTITCPAPANPVSCSIQVTWFEHAVSIDKQSAAGTAQTTSSTQGTFAPTYTLYVEP